MFFEWHPQVIHDLHESVALLMSWNGTGPLNHHMDPITYAERLELSFHEVQTLTGFGMPGVWTWNFGEDFAHLYLDSVAINHNADRARLRDLRQRQRRDHGDHPAGQRNERRGSVVPPLAARHHSRCSGRRATMSTTTRPRCSRRWMTRPSRRHALLRNSTRKRCTPGVAGSSDAPFGFVIPAGSGRSDARGAARRAAAVAAASRCSARRAPLTLKEGTFPAGTYVVRLDQPYRNYAVDLLHRPGLSRRTRASRTTMSRGSCPRTTILRSIASADPQVRAAALTPADAGAACAAARLPAAVRSICCATRARRDCSRRAIALARIQRRHRRAGVHGRGSEYPAGSWIMPAQAGSGWRAARRGCEARARFRERSQLHRGCRATKPPAPRLGLWVPWADTDSIGWVRYSLDQRHIPYVYVRDEDIRAGKLHEQVRRPALRPCRSRARRADPGPIPKPGGRCPSRRPRTPELTARRPSPTTLPAASARRAGRSAVRRRGGLLVTLGSGSMLPLEGGLVRGVRRDAGGPPRSSQGGGAASAAASQDAVTRTPGAHVRVTFEPPRSPDRLWLRGAHLGVPPELSALLTFRAAGCAWPTAPPVWTDPSTAAASCWSGATATARPLVVSGQAWGEDNLIGRAAILDMPVGKGHVVTFNFNPLHRDLNRGDQRHAVECTHQLAGDPGAAARALKARAFLSESGGYSAAGRRATPRAAVHARDVRRFPSCLRRHHGVDDRLFGRLHGSREQRIQ